MRKNNLTIPDAPKELVSISELIQQQQAILAKNGENARKRQNLVSIQNQHASATAEVERLEQLLADAKAKESQLAQDLAIANTDAMDLLDESTEEIENNIAEIDEINRKVRANLDKDKAEEDAKGYHEQYKET